MEPYLYVLGGFVILLLSGNFLVRSAVCLARHFHLSTLVVGVTIVSFGTSMPELIVSLGAALKGHPDISVGNVVGSNISNIALVLGLTAFFLPVPVSRNSITMDWPVMMFVSILFYGLIFRGIIGFVEGSVFVAMLVFYVFWLIRKSRKSLVIPGLKTAEPKFTLGKSILLFLVSSAGLYFGADFLVDGASSMAEEWNVSERVISVSIIAFGTSVPELATSMTAAMKKEMDISLGNIIGSNIFNILGILGVTGMIKAIDLNPSIFFDAYWMLGISALLLVFMLPAGKGLVQRWKGLVLMLIYLVYIVLLYKT